MKTGCSFLESSQSQHKVWFPELFLGVRDATKGRCYKLLVLMDRIFQLFQNAGIEKTEVGKVEWRSTKATRRVLLTVLELVVVRFVNETRIFYSDRSLMDFDFVGSIWMFSVEFFC